MSSGSFKEFNEAYHPLKVIYGLFVIVLWLVPYIIYVSPYWSYGPLALLFVPTLYEAVEKLYARQMSSELFMSLATVIALLGGEQSAIFVVLMILYVAHYVDLLVKQRTEDAISSLLELIPQEVLIQEGSDERFIPLHDVIPGMLVRIKTGGRIPVDGTVSEGVAHLDESILTGESLPSQKFPGDEVFAGTCVEAGSIIVLVSKVGDATFFGKIRMLVDQAGKHKAPIVRFTDRITQLFTLFFLFFILGVWLITANTRMVVTLLVFGSPLELILITPLTMLAAIVSAFRRGILVKSGSALESFARTDVLIFDKTGTLTVGSPHIIAITTLDSNYSQADILRLAAIAEKRSGHLIAKAIMLQAAHLHLDVPDPERYSSISGQGIIMSYLNRSYYLGNRAFIESSEYADLDIPQSYFVEDSLTSFYVATDKKVLGIISLADEIKSDARAMIEACKERGLNDIVLLSGDKLSVAQKVAEQVGIAQVYGEMKPDEKLAFIIALQEKGHTVTMVGDGINDAPALKQADVGIAIGNMGMEPAIAAADMVLMADKLEHIVFLYDLSCEAMRTIKQNLLVGFAVTHAVGIILALLSLITPIQAALLHAVPDLLILLRGGRLLHFQGKKRAE